MAQLEVLFTTESVAITKCFCVQGPLNKEPIIVAPKYVIEKEGSEWILLANTAPWYCLFATGQKASKRPLSDTTAPDVVKNAIFAARKVYTGGEEESDLGMRVQADSTPRKKAHYKRNKQG